MNKPAGKEVIPGVKLTPGAVVVLLGAKKNLTWHQEGNDVVIDQLPDKLPCDYAWAFKIKKADIII
jgi:hypothetical protein